MIWKGILFILHLLSSPFIQKKSATATKSTHHQTFFEILKLFEKNTLIPLEKSETESKHLIEIQLLRAVIQKLRDIPTTDTPSSSFTSEQLSELKKEWNQIHSECKELRSKIYTVKFNSMRREVKIWYELVSQVPRNDDSSTVDVTCLHKKFKICIQEQTEKVRQMLLFCNTLIENEEMEYKSNRNKYGEDWTLRPSKEVNIEFKELITTAKHKLESSLQINTRMKEWIEADQRAWLAIQYCELLQPLFTILERSCLQLEEYLISLHIFCNSSDASQVQHAIRCATQCKELQSCITTIHKLGYEYGKLFIKNKTVLREDLLGEVVRHYEKVNHSIAAGNQFLSSMTQHVKGLSKKIHQYDALRHDETETLLTLLQK